MTISTKLVPISRSLRPISSSYTIFPSFNVITQRPFTVQPSNSFDNISLWGEPLDYINIRPLPNPQGFLLYPNPTHDHVTVEADGLMEVKVYGVMGREVKRVAANGQQKVTFSVEELPAGLYVVRAVDRNGRQMSQKILVVK